MGGASGCFEAAGRVLDFVFYTELVRGSWSCAGLCVLHEARSSFELVVVHYVCLRQLLVFYVHADLGDH